MNKENSLLNFFINAMIVNINKDFNIEENLLLNAE
jgi:hypothetical protein